MSQTKSRSLLMVLGLTVILVMLLALTFTPSTASTTAQGLFVDADQRGSVDVSADPSISRTRYVDVNFDMLDGAEAGDTILLNLYDDVTFEAVLQEKQALNDEGYVWLGRLDGITLSQVIMVVRGGQIAGNVTMPDGFYQVRWAGDGVHAIYSIDQSAFPDEAEPIPVDIPDSSVDELDPMADDGSIIDVMVVWTPAARTAAGGTVAMQNLVNLAVTEANQSYANSLIDPRLNLVHLEEVAYTESGNMGTDLGRLQNPGDGHMDNVHTLRDTHMADMVSLIVESNQYCGIAYLMTTVSTTFASNAFSVVARSCATGYYSYAHELGHNQSARHDWYVDATANSPYSYNHGFVYVPGGWRTVMAYDNECDPGNCTRLPYWSNPSVSYGGVPMGVPAGTSTACTAGSHPNCDADNHLTLNNTAYTVANFRSAAAPGPIIYWSRTVDDDNIGNSSGNADGYVDCGENIELYVDLYNDGADTATSVYATISSTDPNIAFLFNTTSSYGNIAAAASATNTDDFDFSVSPSTPHGHYINFNLGITAANGGPWSDSFSLPVFCLSPDGYEPDDSSAAATTISDGVAQTHNIYPVGDEDWLTFTLPQESGVLLETSGPSGDSRMWLYDSGLAELEYNDDGGAGLWSRIDRVCGVDALPAGTYYVKIDEYGDNWPIEAYDINFTVTGACATPPDINVTPPSLSVALPLNGSTTEFLTLENLGGGPLSYSISDEETGSPAPGFATLSGRSDGPDASSTDNGEAFPQPTPPYGREAAAAVNPVLIIQDSLPWGYEAIQATLTANGIAYDQVDSSQIATINLAPYWMVVIPSTQGDPFVNTFNANIAKFEAYVNAGGRLWLSTVTQGGVNLLTPGGVVSAYDAQEFNDIVAPGHPWVSGVPNPMSGNLASHNSFTNLYPGSTVVAQAQTSGNPTLVDYRYGAGRVLLTGQTLEIAWGYGWDGAPIVENSLLDLFYATSPVLIIQDLLPWGYDSIQQILDAHNIDYDQINSAQIATVNLAPYEMVVVPSVQGEAFYTVWNANIAKFEAYVNAGGKLWQSTCNYSATPVEPLTVGGAISATDREEYNDIVAPGHPWVIGVPGTVFGNYANHDSFTNLYPGSTVVAQTQTSVLPTLVDYNYGSGRVLISGLTLEHGWAAGRDFGPILENSLLNMLGAGADALWLAESPTVGVVGAGGWQDIAVTFDATGLVPGIYTANILVQSDDPDEPLVVVPVTMEVTGCPGGPNAPLFTTQDNEDNALTGMGDCDMDVYLFNDSPIQPIEFNILVPDASGIVAAELHINNWDVDESSGEVDEVYFNGHYAGTLTGANGTWSTTVLTLDPAWVATGDNLVEVFIDVANPGVPTWAVDIDWGQIVIGTRDAYIRDAAILNPPPYNPGTVMDIGVEVDTTLQSQDVRTEINLRDPNGVILDGQLIDHTIVGTADDPVFTSLTIPPGAFSGPGFDIQVLVYDLNTALFQDSQVIPFEVVLEGADLEVVKTDRVDPVKVGELVAYEIVVSNNGPEVATNVVLVDTMSDYTTFVSSNPGSPTCTESSNVLTCNLGTLNPGSNATVTIVVQAPDVVASLLNVADVSADQPDPFRVNNQVLEQTLAVTGYLVHDCDVPGNPIVNCSFENNFTDWVIQDLAVPFYPLQVGGAGLTPGFGLFSSVPTHGDLAALHGFDGTGPGWIRIAQDVVLPPLAGELVFDYRAGWDLLTYNYPGTSDRHFVVTIEPAGGGPALQTTPVMWASMDTIILDSADQTGIVDVSAFAGGSVRISFDWYVPDPSSGPAFFQLDNVMVRETLAPARLVVVPPLQDVPVGGEASVDIFVEDVADLYGLSMELRFNPSFVEVVDADGSTAGVQITPGSCPLPDFVVQNTVDNGTGVINYDVASLAESLPCNGTGLVATITFRGLNPTPAGPIPLEFTSWLLANINGFAIPTNAIDGELNVVLSLGTVEGLVTMQGRADHSLVDVCAWDGPSLVDCILTDAAGHFELLLPAGSYDIRAVTGRYLDAEKLGVSCTAGSTTTLASVMLWGGDANDDCVINILDLSFMGARYLCTAADPCYNVNADINNDGIINIQDIVLGGSNYLRSCWIVWP